MDVQELAKIALQPMLEGITYQERKALPSTSTQVSIECPMVAITTAVNVQTYRIDRPETTTLSSARPPYRGRSEPRLPALHSTLRVHDHREAVRLRDFVRRFVKHLLERHHAAQDGRHGTGTGRTWSATFLCSLFDEFMSLLD